MKDYEQNDTEDEEEFELSETELSELDLDDIDPDELEWDVPFQDVSDESSEEAEPKAEFKTEAESDDTIEIANFSDDEVIPVNSKATNRITEDGIATIVNTHENGRRFTISSKLHTKLGNPSSLQMGFIKGCLLVGEQLGERYTSYLLKKQGAKQVIYNKGLVEQITVQFNLDFSGGCTSHTFHTVKYQKRNGAIIGLISL